MSRTARLERVERSVWDREIERVAKEIADELGLPDAQVVPDAKRLWTLLTHGLSIEDALRLWAAEESLDPDAMDAELRRRCRA